MEYLPTVERIESILITPKEIVINGSPLRGDVRVFNSKSAAIAQARKFERYHFDGTLWEKNNLTGRWSNFR